jgi:hypothetical protein
MIGDQDAFSVSFVLLYLALVFAVAVVEQLGGLHIGEG